MMMTFDMPPPQHFTGVPLQRSAFSRRSTNESPRLQASSLEPEVNQKWEDIPTLHRTFFAARRICYFFLGIGKKKVMRRGLFNLASFPFVAETPLHGYTIFGGENSRHLSLRRVERLPTSKTQKLRTDDIGACSVSSGLVMLPRVVGGLLLLEVSTGRGTTKDLSA